eukprot:TRINITY_DN29081_c0_g1_i1.p1 TRINITY_DN29081_c0_g1~~TRINITY_DN29081_c0_g1_i1.p1  ORF type:complete len:130 (-),score=17.44 TRINITY_DN29081_c0_g1_i1:45-434(-)
MRSSFVSSSNALLRRSELTSELISELEEQFPQQPKVFLLCVLVSFMGSEDILPLVRLRVMMYIKVITLLADTSFQDWTIWHVINFLDEALFDGLQGRINHKAPTRLLCHGLQCSEEIQEIIADLISSLT